MPRLPLWLFLGVVATSVLCFFFGLDLPAYAHDCPQRLKNVTKLAELPKEAVEDCMRTGYAQALATLIAGLIAGGLIARAVNDALKEAKDTTSQNPDPCAGDLAQMTPAELRERIDVLEDWISKQEDILVKLAELVEEAEKTKTAPDPNRLQPIATAAGFRSKEFHAAPDYVQSIINSIEHSKVRSAIDSFKLAALGVEGERGATFADRIKWGHLIVEKDRTELFEERLEAERDRLQACLKARTAPAQPKK